MGPFETDIKNIVDKRSDSAYQHEREELIREAEDIRKSLSERFDILTKYVKARMLDWHYESGLHTVTADYYQEGIIGSHGYVFRLWVDETEIYFTDGKGDVNCSSNQKDIQASEMESACKFLSKEKEAIKANFKKWCIEKARRAPLKEQKDEC